VTAETETNMDLDELQSVRDRERQQDKPQQLRDSFYEDAAEFVDQLRRERDRVASEAEDPYAPEARRLHDEIETAEQFVEDIYERRIGKTVKAASLDAAALPAEVDGLTREERELFEQLVERIRHNRDRVLSALDPDEPTSRDEPADTSRAASADTSQEEPADTSRAASADTSKDEPADIGAEPVRESTRSSTSSGDRAPDTSPPPTSTVDPGAEPTARDHPDPPADTGPDDQPEPDDDRPVRNDGGRGEAPAGASETAEQRSADGESDRTRVLVTEDVDTFMGVDTRDYDLSADDVVVLPAANAETLLDRGAARQL
jgi:DNA replication factor GINS